MNHDGWAKVCSTREIPRGAGRNFKINNQDVVIFHTDQGFFCRSGLCKHNNVKLELGRVHGDVVTCPFHNWQYRISTGKGVSPDWTHLSCYPLEVREGDIWIAVAPEPESDDKTDVLDTSRFKW